MGNQHSRRGVAPRPQRYLATNSSSTISTNITLNMDANASTAAAPVSVAWAVAAPELRHVEAQEDDEEAAFDFDAPGAPGVPHSPSHRSCDSGLSDDSSSDDGNDADDGGHALVPVQPESLPKWAALVSSSVSFADDSSSVTCPAAGSHAHSRPHFPKHSHAHRSRRHAAWWDHAARSQAADGDADAAQAAAADASCKLYGFEHDPSVFRAAPITLSLAQASQHGESMEDMLTRCRGQALFVPSSIM